MLAELDERERNYDRHDVTELVDADLGGRVWAYVGSLAGRPRLARGRRRGTAVVARGYLRRCRPTSRPTCRCGRYSGVT